jgi:hypothetical protein
MKPMKHRDTSNLTEWARRINRGWFVRGGLADTTAAWLDYLEQTDPTRLLAACEMARALSRGPDHTIDPKPWFYAGLFSLATEEEARHYLTNHHFTAAAIPVLAQDAALNQWSTGLSPASRELLAVLRQAVLSQVRSAGPPAPATPQATKL